MNPWPHTLICDIDPAWKQMIPCMMHGRSTCKLADHRRIWAIRVSLGYETPGVEDES